MTSNTITAIEAVKTATALAGVDFIDSGFGIFRVSDDETSRFYQVILQTACEQVLQDYFDKVDNQFQSILTLEQAIVTPNGFYEYAIINSDIYRILKVLNSSQELVQTDNLLDLKKKSNTYFLDPFTLKVGHELGTLTVICLSSAIFVLKPDGQTLPDKRSSTLKNDGDIILLDKYLVIYKVGELIMKHKSLNYNVMVDEYGKRLNYLIEKNADSKGRIDVRHY